MSVGLCPGRWRHARESASALRQRENSYPSKAATPGSVLPSIHSRNAPPAVET